MALVFYLCFHELGATIVCEFFAILLNVANGENSYIRRERHDELRINITTAIPMIEIHQWRYELRKLFERDGFQNWRRCKSVGYQLASQQSILKKSTAN